ncbi:MAG: chloride channel protein [Desulfurococcales archaeon]|nr:chloride channel protein [Desulfurococcales archaeon]MCE4626397.1 chloride channel protein [Desulfurococcales archaeon]
MRLSPRRFKEWVVALAYAEKWLILGTLIGIASGLIVIVFFELLVRMVAFTSGLVGVTLETTTTDLSIVYAETSNRIMMIIIILAGVAASAPIVYRIAPEAEGGGTESAVFSYHRRAALIPARVPFVKLIASVLTIGTGTSAGVEGPSVHMGAGIGSIMARILGLSRRDRSIAFTAGIAAALSAAFRAPLGSTFFATEVLYKRDIEAHAFMPSFVASLVSYAVTAPYFKYAEPLPRILVAPEEIYSTGGLLTLIGLGFFIAPFVYLFVTMILSSDKVFRRLVRRLGLPIEAKPILGTLIAIPIILAFPIAAGSGKKAIVLALTGEINEYIPFRDILPLTLLLIMAALSKMTATSLMVGSGASGGVFAPSLLAGAFLGWAYYLLLGDYAALPGHVYAYVGMAAFFGAAGKVPLAVSIIIGEMGRNYYLIAPTLAAAYIARELTGEKSVYPPQLKERPVI